MAVGEVGSPTPKNWELWDFWQICGLNMIEPIFLVHKDYKMMEDHWTETRAREAARVLNVLHKLVRSSVFLYYYRYNCSCCHYVYIYIHTYMYTCILSIWITIIIVVIIIILLCFWKSDQLQLRRQNAGLAGLAGLELAGRTWRSTSRASWTTRGISTIIAASWRVNRSSPEFPARHMGGTPKIDGWFIRNKYPKKKGW